MSNEYEPTEGWGAVLFAGWLALLVVLTFGVFGIHRIAYALDRAYPKPAAAEVQK